jgi:hypothetical protein
MVGQAPIGLFGHSLGPVESPTGYGGVGSSRTGSRDPLGLVGRPKPGIVGQASVVLVGVPH